MKLPKILLTRMSGTNVKHLFNAVILLFLILKLIEAESKIIFHHL